MQSTFIARDTSAANLRSDRLQVAPASLSPSELLREALGLRKRTSTPQCGATSQPSWNCLAVSTTLSL